MVKAAALQAGQEDGPSGGGLDVCGWDRELRCPQWLTTFPAPGPLQLRSGQQGRGAYQLGFPLPRGPKPQKGSTCTGERYLPSLQGRSSTAFSGPAIGKPLGVLSWKEPPVR